MLLKSGIISKVGKSNLQTGWADGTEPAPPSPNCRQPYESQLPPPTILAAALHFCTFLPVGVEGRGLSRAWGGCALPLEPGWPDNFAKWGLAGVWNMQKVRSWLNMLVCHIVPGFSSSAWARGNEAEAVLVDRAYPKWAAWPDPVLHHSEPTST